ncbi:hypothetical protein, partial [Klebsiella pneumoniae]|uniref:hypothetical protein n=1 Tax=Klebsiella pneumoniae TaxID=573 RepID=UPI00148749C7
LLWLWVAINTAILVTLLVMRERLTGLASRRLGGTGRDGADAADVVTGLVLTTAFLTAERVRGRRSDGTAAEVVTDLRRLLGP